MSDTSHLKVRDRARNGREGHAISPGRKQDIFFGPPTAPNSFKRSLNSLHDLMELISPDSAVRCSCGQKSIWLHLLHQLYEAARETSDALRTACDVSFLLNCICRD